MAIDSDDMVSLPTPPPPRPAARREAIETALRRFDGIEETRPVREKPKRSWWASHQRQVGAFAAAAVIAVVSIPVALTVLQDQPRPAPQAKAPAPSRALPKPQFADRVEAPAAQPEEVSAAEVPRSKLPLEPHEEAVALPAPLADEQKAKNETRELAISAPPASPAPPPPPPPPAAPAPERDQVAGYAADSSIVVTGSSVQRAEPSTQHGRLAAKRAADAANPSSPMMEYGKFLSRLKSAVRSGNRGAVSSLIAFPLRVNTSEGQLTYANRKAVEQDFERIFTPRVRQAILDQRSDRLFVRDQGAMIGDGEVWLDQTCRNSTCSSLGPVRIKAVNP